MFASPRRRSLVQSGCSLQFIPYRHPRRHAPSYITQRLCHRKHGHPYLTADFVITRQLAPWPPASPTQRGEHIYGRSTALDA
eukprot:4226520-Pyramimonas_sp.AAC.1